jgi:hypothetical protein
MAHVFQGFGYNDLGESTLAAESTSKAYQLRDRVSEQNGSSQLPHTICT